jgi:hypothetical protein
MDLKAYKQAFYLTFEDADLPSKAELEQIIKGKLLLFPSFMAIEIRPGYTNDDFINNIVRVRITLEQHNLN